eukprot:PhF_6_TR7906/c0_g1_i1/m.11738
MSKVFSFACFLLVQAIFIPFALSAQPLLKEAITVRYVGQVIPQASLIGETPTAPQTPSPMLVAGQEARLRVTMTANTKSSRWANVYFNASSGSAKVRIIPTYVGRASSGTRLRCNNHGTDYWQEFWGLSSSQYLFGHNMITQGFITFTVPPFPWRACIQVTSSYRNFTTRNISNPTFRSLRGTRYRAIPRERFIVVNTSFFKGDSATGVWSELSNMDTIIQAINASTRYVWTSSSTMYTGDHAHIKITQNGYQHDFYVPTPGNIINEDVVKLVPAGFPCTYEKSMQKDYCGSNRMTLRGRMPDACVREGSVQHGVPYMGSNQYNPYGQASFSPRQLTLDLMKGGETLVAYLELPAAGTYDVCFSPKARRNVGAVVLNASIPVFQKIFRQDSTTCSSVGVTNFKTFCRPTGRLVITTKADSLRWSSPHIYPGSWGAIRIFHNSQSTILNTNPATAWAYSSTREYFTTTGGDQFRLIPISALTTTAITYGKLFKDVNGNTFKTIAYSLRSLPDTLKNRYTEFNRLTSTGASYSTFGASGDSFVQTLMETPDQGSTFTLSSSGGGGCWNWYYDNYGNYGKALNGISTSMNSASYCCSVVSTSCTNAGGTGCSMSDTDHDGVTASADLGADPRLNMFSWTHNSAAASEAWAYVRFPLGGRWNVCYRQAGTENWRVIQAASGGVNYFDASKYMRLNYTYHVNDSQATTWGPLYLRDPQKTLTTQNYNYFGSSDATVGSAVKIVKYTSSCYTDAGESETYDPKPGLQECEIGFCGGSSSCAGCTGHSDDSSVLRWEVVFYVRMPAQLTTGYYRVCFKYGNQNWLQLQDPRYIKHTYMTSPWKFNTRPPPTLDVSLQDWREGTWGKVLIRRLVNPNTHPFNIDPNNRFGAGDVVRFVQNRTANNQPARCDITWGATSGEFVLQNFNPLAAAWNLGVYCLSSSTTTTSRCFTGKLTPTDTLSGDVGTYPYTNVDSTADGSYISDQSAEGAVAFITIPPRLSTTSAGYRMCYKPQASNWIEVPKLWSGAPNPFVVTVKPSYTATVTGTVTSTIYAGQYGYITIVGNVDLDADLVKLVLDVSGGCDRPAAGLQTPGNTYASFSWRKKVGSQWTEAARGGQAFVRSGAPSSSVGTLGSRGTTQSARAYITFPTVAGLSQTTNRYKICYMSRPNTAGDIETMNWHLLGSVDVFSPGIAFTVENQPYNSGVLGVRFVTGGSLLFNTLPFGDSAKLVSFTSPCYGPEITAFNRPNGILSRHVGQEYTATEMGLSSDNITLQEMGIFDLGDSDLPSTATSRFETTLPYSTVRTYYKVCFKPYNLPWMELNQAPLARQVYALGPDGLLTFDHAIRTYTITSPIIGVSPFSGAVYATGISYESTLIGGAATALVGSTNTSYFYLSHATDWANYPTDTFKLILYSEEVVRGVYNNLPKINCNSRSVMEITSGVGSIATNPTRASFAANLPTRGGRYLFCYRKTGLNVWLKMEPDATSTSAGLTNPIKIIPSSLSFAYSKATGNISVTDLFSTLYNSKETALGAINSNDKIYVVNATDHCGLSHGYAWDPKAPTSASSLSNTIDNAPKNLFGNSNVTQQASVSVPVASGWYKLCYKRTSSKTMATASTDTTPTPYASINWYQIINSGELVDGGNTAFFVTAKANKLRIEGCPKINSTRPLRTGQPFDITVSVLDTQNNVLPFSIGTWSYLITAVPDGNSFAIVNSAGSCRPSTAPIYGWDASNLRQWTQGQITFSLSILSGCPTNGCSLTFSASDGIKAPGGVTSPEISKCVLTVRSTPVTSLGVWEGPTSCRLDEICTIRVAAFWNDGGLAHTAIDDVQLTTVGLVGLSLKVSGVTVVDSTVKVGSLSQGFFVANVQFDVLLGSLFNANTPVSLTFSAGGKNTTYIITVIRPFVSKYYVVDFYPDDNPVTGLSDSDKFIRPYMVPSWEPSDTYFMGIVSPPGSLASGKSALEAGPGYHMLALQVYTAVIRPVDTEGRYVDKVTLLDPAKPLITIVNTDPAFVGNKVLKVCDTQEVCDAAHTGVQMTSSKQKVTFRLKNNIGCSSGAPCTLSFNVNGLDVGTSIKTPVRNPATQLRVTCWQNTASTETGLGSGFVGSCPTTTVEKGYALKVEAVDGNGRLDDYFEGNALAILAGGNGFTNDRGISITTTAILASTSSAPLTTPSPFVKGVAWFFGVTLTAPCSSGCNLQIVSDWGAALANLGPIIVTPSTVKLACSLNTQLYACVINSEGNCDSISGYFNYDTSATDNNKVSLIYKDTSVCATVTAISADGLRTLYETNWVMYWAQAVTVTGSTTINPVSITDVGTSPTRVKAMTRSAVSFCFKVSSSQTKANFRIRFAAQRFNDANYWSKGSNGECTLGTFSYWGRKHVANLVISKVTDPITPISPLLSSSVNLFAQRADLDKTTLSTILSFGLLDHYGNAIASADVDSTQLSNSVVVSACSLDDSGRQLATTCTTSSVDSTSNIAVSVANPKEGGVMKATLTAASISIAGEITYSMILDRWCLGCYLTFKVKTPSGDYKTKFPGNSESTPTARANWFIVIHNTVEQRLLAFRVGTSPLNYWQKWDTTAVPLASKGSVALFKDTCFTTDKSSCSPVESWFQPTVCDEQTSGTSHRIASSASGTPIQVYALSALSGSGALSSVNEPTCNNGDCSTLTNVVAQVDILNSYVIGIDMGSQILQCSGVSCIDDLSAKPKQLVAAFGSTAIEAAKKFASAITFSSTNFVVSGVYPSNYYQISGGKLASQEVPSFSSKVSFTVDSNGTTARIPDSITTGNYYMVFKGPKVAERFTIKPTATETKCPIKPTYACVGSSGDCAYTGYQRMATLDSIAFSYAYKAGDLNSVIPTNTPVPITAQVEDGNSVRVSNARGTVSVDLYSWSGCNNGGTLTVVNGVNNKDVSLDSGRVTVWVMFSEPCERCVLRFILTPDSTQNSLYTNLTANKAQFVQYSQQIDVRNNIPQSATYLIATNTPRDQKNTITISDKITVNMIPVRSIGQSTGNLQVSDNFATGEVYAYNQVQTSGSNWVWFGNGGVLRKDESAAPREHHTVSTTFTSTGSVSISFMFSRTCPNGCKVRIVYHVNGNLNSFLVQNLRGTDFVVTATSSKYLLAGYRPRLVPQDSDFTLSLWHCGEGLNIPFAGVGTTTLNAMKATKTVEDATNGDGGDLTDLTFTLDRTEIHRLRLSRSSNKLRIGIGLDSALMAAHTRATYLRVDRPEGSKSIFMHPMTEFASFGVYAIDDFGFTDIRVGGFTGCHAYDPLNCPTNPGQDLACALSANGFTEGGFTPTDDNFLAARNTEVQTMSPDAANRQLLNGVNKNVMVQFTRPVRNAYPIFKIGPSLTSAASSTRRPIESNVIDVSVGTTGLNLAVKRSFTDAISMYSMLSMEIGLVKLVADLSTTSQTSYIAVEADNMVRISFDANCPPVMGSPILQAPLRKGYAAFNFSFVGATGSGAKCAISAEALSGSGVCSTPNACKSSIQVTVAAVSVYKWAWITPSVADNIPSGVAGPLFGAMGRSVTFRVALLGKLSATQDTIVTSCDDVTTPNVKESCKLTVVPDASCIYRPTIASDVWNETTGEGSIQVIWAEAPGTYTCKISVTVVDGNNKPLAVDANPGGTPEVTVSRPTNVIMLTNTTSAFNGQLLRTGVPYSFSYAIVDGKGLVCKGDTGDSGTELTAELVTNDKSARSIPGLSLYNVNVTSSARNWVPPSPTTGKAIGGVVTFSFVFTNSSINLGLSGFRIRVTATKGFSSSTVRVDSGRIDTVIAARTLRFDPRASLPRNWVMSRPFPRVVLQAVDILDPRFVPSGPNVARKPTEIGNAEKISWKVNPLPSVYPLGFISGVKDSNLVAGQAEFVLSFTTERDGVYELAVGTDPASPIQGTPAFPINFQTIVALPIVSRDFAANTPNMCSTDCMLPNSSATVVNVNGSLYLNTSIVRPFNVSVILADPVGRPVLGDNQSFIQVRLVRQSGSANTVVLSLPNTGYSTREDNYWVTASQGEAKFTLGFVGSTLDTLTNVHSHVSLEFSCPRYVPAAVARTPSDIENPCYNAIPKALATTLPIRVNDPSVSRTVFSTPVVLSAKPVFRIPTSVQSISQFNASDFKIELSKRVQSKFPYITPSNADAVVVVTACEVIRSIFTGSSDLGSSVCTTSGKCSGANTECPAGVLRCSCPSTKKSSSLSHLLSRYLMQTSSSATAQVQVEASFDLSKAVGFAATTESDIVSAYSALSTETLTILKSDTTLTSSFNIDTKNVGSRVESAPISSATPSPVTGGSTPPPAFQNGTTTSPSAAPGTDGPVTSSPSTTGNNAWSLKSSVLSLVCIVVLMVILQG